MIALKEAHNEATYTQHLKLRYASDPTKLFDGNALSDGRREKG